ncbi:MAG TPA: AAA family ATPase [Longimicrobium sp.]|jgi:ATP-dependent Clp protease ATP-binding subunit ClpB|uniref:ATP-dependent Clp protease ATP-binding subunit n=1 Tax=Longimicrobium sp. TaxID=2029185 RepID=UPI002EDB10EF
MDLTRLALDLSAALEQARAHAARRGAGYIQPRHLLAALLEPGGALAQLAPALGLDAGAAREAVETAGDDGAARLEPGRQPIAGRALRDLLDRAFARADRRGAHTVGALEVALAAAEPAQGELPRALRDAGWSPDRLAAALDSPEVMQPAAEQAAPAAGSVLARFARDLTADAREGRLPPVLGRDAETRHVVQTLLRKSKNNPVLVGDPGTGKTAVVEGLALRMAAGDVPASLRGCRLLALDLTSLVAGAKYRGEFEERIKAVVDEVKAQKDVVLFLDELHTLVGAGGNAGGMDAANILKPALARGELRCIGATTHDEYRETIEKDGALARRFEKVTVDEPDDETVLQMLHGARGHYERHHGVTVSDGALDTVVRLARRHLRDRFFPDKAFDVLDEAAARLRMQLESRPEALDTAERELARAESRLAGAGDDADRPALQASVERLRGERDALDARWREQQEVADGLGATHAAIAEKEAELAAAEGRGDTAAAAELRYGTLKYLREQRADLEGRAEALAASGVSLGREVGPNDVAEVVARRAGVPLSRMMESERERLLLLEERLRARVHGQDAAVDALADAARRMRADLRARRKPASFLFVGPTGVGKTELAKALAEALFDDETALVRIDMAEYKEAHSVSGLIGSRPGLVGSEQGGFLTEQVRRSPHSIVLFDEVEKAHPEVIDILLGVLDEGRLTDARGRFCDFTGTLIILTSNLGVREAMAGSDDPAERKEIILKVVQASLRPELFNRLGDVIAFDALEPAVLQRIVRTHLSGAGTRLRDEYGATLEADPEAIALLAELAYDPAYGARPVDRTVERMVVSDLSRLVIGGDVAAGSLVRVVRDRDGVALLAGTRQEVEEEARRMAEEAALAAAEAAEAERAAAAAAEAERIAAETAASSDPGPGDGVAGDDADARTDAEAAAPAGV